MEMGNSITTIATTKNLQKQWHLNLNRPLELLSIYIKHGGQRNTFSGILGIHLVKPVVHVSVT
jgi:hypothetical protein